VLLVKKNWNSCFFWVCACFADKVGHIWPVFLMMGCSWAAPGLLRFSLGLLLGCSWAAPGLLLGCSWGCSWFAPACSGAVPGLLLGCSWDAPGLLWAAPGLLLGRSWPAAPRLVWAALGCTWAALGLLWDVPELLRAAPGLLQPALGCSWAAPGLVWAAPGRLLACWSSLGLGCSGLHMGCSGLHMGCSGMFLCCSGLLRPALGCSWAASGLLLGCSWAAPGQVQSKSKATTRQLQTLAFGFSFLKYTVCIICTRSTTVAITSCLYSKFVFVDSVYDSLSSHYKSVGIHLGSSSGGQLNSAKGHDGLVRVCGDLVLLHVTIVLHMVLVFRIHLNIARAGSLNLQNTLKHCWGRFFEVARYI
jgi:hypothetical protein